MSKIVISPKHGVNPSLLCCPICGKDTGVALVGRLPNDTEAPRHMIDANGPCEDCQKKIEEYKAQGFVLFVVSDEYDRKLSEAKKDLSPWLFFNRLVVLKKDTIENLFKGVDTSRGAAFIPQSIADQIGI